MNLLKRLIKNITVIILLILLISSFCVPNNIYATSTTDTASETTDDTAVTIESARQRIADAAASFAETDGPKCKYDGNGDYQAKRAATYAGGYPQSEYIFECVGFVNYILHQFIGLDYGPASSGAGGFVTPGGIRDTTHFGEVDINSIQPGDILISSSHVAIYIGNNLTVDCIDANGGDDYSDYTSGRAVASRTSTPSWTTYTRAARLISIDGVHFSPIEGGENITTPGAGNWDTEVVDLDQIAEQFTFSGMPTTVIKEEQNVNIFKWFFDGISGFMDYLVGTLFSVAIKGPILSITEGIKAIVNSFLNNLSDTEGIDYNIEKIIFNEVPILDINFFSGTAAGQDVEANSPVGLIRKTVATWYVSFRNLVIIAMAAIIIYIGIRMALSTIPQRKATYKRMLIGWVQALVIIFVIHMVMILIININNNVVDIFKNSINQIDGLVTAEDAEDANETSIYDTIRTRAYDFRISVGFPATIIYLVLIVTWIRFLWVYAKRSFTILILVVIAPFIGAKYAIDSASGKKGTSFSSWLYDFTFNVLIQTVHALIYVVIMSSVINFAFDSIIGFIVALIFLNFMLSADEIFRSIFNFSGRSSLSGETAKQEGYKEVMENFTGAVFVGQVFRGTWNFAKGVGRVTTGAGKVVYKEITKTFPNVKKSANNLLNSIDQKIENTFPEMKEDSNNPNSRQSYKARISNLIHYNAKIRRLSRLDGTIGVKGRKLKKNISSHTKKRYTSNFKIIKNAVTGVGSVVLAVPLTVINTTAGAALMTNGILTLKKFPHKKRYKSEKGQIKNQSDLSYQRDKYTKKRDKIYQSIDLLESIQNQEDNIRNEMDAINKNSKISDNDISNFKNASNAILVEASSKKITDLIDEYVKQNDIDTIDKSSINDIIDGVAEQIGINIKTDRTTRSIIGSKAKSRVIMQNAKKRQEAQKKAKPGEKVDVKFTKDDISDAIQQSLVDTTVEKDFRKVTRDLISLDKTINKFEKKAKTKYRKANKFLEDL